MPRGPTRPASAPASPRHPHVQHVPGEQVCFLGLAGTARTLQRLPGRAVSPTAKAATWRSPVSSLLFPDRRPTLLHPHLLQDPPSVSKQVLARAPSLPTAAPQASDLSPPPAALSDQGGCTPG